MRRVVGAVRGALRVADGGTESVERIRGVLVALMHLRELIRERLAGGTERVPRSPGPAGDGRVAQERLHTATRLVGAVRNATHLAGQQRGREGVAGRRI